MGQMKQVGNHKTIISNDEEFINVVYHSTAVVKFNEKSIILNSGGYHTNTTKTRMNQTSNQFNLGYKVYQKNFSWFVDFKGKTIDYHDNIKLSR